MFENYANHDIAAYAGYIIDEQELLKCTSGGVATALARKMLQIGGCVVGVTYSDDFYKAQYEVITCEDQLEKLRGSKYVEVDKGTIYKDVRLLLEEGKKVLFFGLPCVVAAMRQFLGKEYDDFFAIELICHGPTKSEVHLQYINYLEKKYKSKVIDFSVRKKKEKWNPGYLYAKFENGRTVEKYFDCTEYGYAFSVMGRSSCYHCQFRGDNRTGDIMLGDFWGACENDVFWNPKGVSAILVHTLKGKLFLEDTSEIRLFSTTFERIVEKNPSVINPRPLNPKREKFEDLFTRYGLVLAVKKTRVFREKIIILVRQCMPTSLLPLAIKIYHKIRKVA